MDWASYSLSDFLMFSPQVYWRLVARANAAWWPAQLLGVAAAAALPWLLRQGGEAAARAALLLLAAGWAWVGWAFHWQRYAEVFLGAPWVAAACGVQALLLVAAAAWPGVRTPARPAALAGSVLLLAALLYPLLAPLTGHDWGEAEVFGFMPEPTALATVGALLALGTRPRWLRGVLALVPVASLLLGGVTRWLIAR